MNSSTRITREDFIQPSRQKVLLKFRGNDYLSHISHFNMKPLWNQIQLGGHWMVNHAAMHLL
jgi:hypothetical protein